MGQVSMRRAETPAGRQFTCWQNIIYAHCLAAQELRHTDAENRVGFVSTGRICYPVSESKADVDAAPGSDLCLPRRGLGLHPHDVARPSVLGRWPSPDLCGPQLSACIGAVPQYINDALSLGRPDMLAEHLQCRACTDGNECPCYVERPAGYAHTAMNWPVEPESLNWGPRYIQERYGLPMFIAENGLSCTDKIYRDGKVHDVERIDFLARYLEKLSEGIQAGATCEGTSIGACWTTTSGTADTESVLVWCTSITLPGGASRKTVPSGMAKSRRPMAGPSDL